MLENEGRIKIIVIWYKQECMYYKIEVIHILFLEVVFPLHYSHDSLTILVLILMENKSDSDYAWWPFLESMNEIDLTVELGKSK